MGISVDEIKKLIDLDQKQDIKEKSKSYNFTKIAILCIVIFLAFIGVLGSTHWGIFKEFVMIDFTNFLEAYGGILITLIGSIGLGGAAKNGISALLTYKKELKDNVSKKENLSDADGKNLVTGGV